MSKISFTFQLVINTVAPLAMLSGCDFDPVMEQNLPYFLQIQNNLPAPIAFCSAHLAATCPHTVQSGQKGQQLFMGAPNGREDVRMEGFDRQKIKVCDKLIDLKLIREVSPVSKLDKDHYQIVIDKSVTDRFCR